MRSLRRRILSIITAFSLCLTMLPFGAAEKVLAAEPEIVNGSCRHHPFHTSDCGYAEEEPGASCTHVHGKECCPVLPDTKEEAEGEASTAEEKGGEPKESTADAAAEEGPVLDCRHTHDDTCGYAPASEGAPCGYVCRICPVQDLIDALPAEDRITAENAADTEAQLLAVDEAKAELTDEEAEQLDKSRYEEAVRGLMRCLTDAEPILPPAEEEPSPPAKEKEETPDSEEDVLHEGTLTLDLSEMLGELSGTPMLLEAAGEYYGDRLEGTAKSFYEQYKEFFTGLQDAGGGDAFTCIHALPDTVKDISMNAIYALIRDHPELFYWINGKVHFRWLDLGGAGYKYVYIYFDAIPEYVAGYGSYRGPDFSYPILDLNGPASGGEAYRQKALQAAAKTAAYADETFDTDYEKIRYFHEEICRLTDYDFDTFYNSNSQTQAHSMYRVFNGEKVVCAGYAKAFKYLCDLSGIRCLLVDGHGFNNAGQSGEHMWNYVELFGNWYLVDATWNDCENTRNYFMIGSSSSYYQGRYKPDLTTGHPDLCTEDYHFVPPNKAHVTVTDSNADRLILGLAWEDAYKEVPSALEPSDILITPEVKIKSVDVTADGTSVTVAFDGHPDPGSYQVRIRNGEKFVYAMDAPDFEVPPTSTIVHVSVKEAKVGSSDVVLLLEPESDLFGMPDLTSGTITTNRVHINRRTQSSDGRELTLSISEAIRTDLDYIFYFEDSETFQYEPGSLTIRYQGLPQASRPTIKFEPIYETFGTNRMNVAVKVFITRSPYDKIGDEYVSIVYTINDGPEQIYTEPFLWEAKGSPGDTKAVIVKAYVRSNYPDQYRNSISTKESTFVRVRPEPVSTKVDVSVQNTAPDQAVLTLTPQTASLGMPAVTLPDLTIEPALPIADVVQSEGTVTIFFADVPGPGDYTISLRDTERYQFQPVILHIEAAEPTEPSEPENPDPENPGPEKPDPDTPDKDQTGNTGPEEEEKPSGGTGDDSPGGNLTPPDTGSTSGGGSSSGSGRPSGGNGSSGSGRPSGGNGSSGSGRPSGGDSSPGGHPADSAASGSPQSGFGSVAGTVPAGAVRTSAADSAPALRSVDSISRLPASGSPVPLKPGSDGSVTVDDAFLSAVLAQSGQSSNRNISSNSGAKVVVPISRTARCVTIKPSSMELLAGQNVQELELRMDQELSVYLDQDTLKALHTAADGKDIRLLTEKANMSSLPQTARAALGTFAVYQLSLASFQNGTGTPLALPGDCAAAVRIPCSPKEYENTADLHAFYVDGAGKMRWIEASGYDPEEKAVVFALTEPGIYGIGSRTAVPVSGGIQRADLVPSPSVRAEDREGARRQSRKAGRQKTERLSGPGTRHPVK